MEVGEKSQKTCVVYFLGDFVKHREGRRADGEEEEQKEEVRREPFAYFIQVEPTPAPNVLAPFRAQALHCVNSSLCGSVLSGFIF